MAHSLYHPDRYKIQTVGNYKKMSGGANYMVDHIQKRNIINRHRYMNKQQAHCCCNQPYSWLTAMLEPEGNSFFSCKMQYQILIYIYARRKILTGQTQYVVL